MRQVLAVVGLLLAVGCSDSDSVPATPPPLPSGAAPCPGDVVIASKAALVVFAAQGCNYVLGTLRIDGTDVDRLELPALESVGGLEITGNTGLTAISLPALSWVGDQLVVERNSALSGLDLPELRWVGGTLAARFNRALATLGLPTLGAAGSLDVSGNLQLASLAAPALASVATGLTIHKNPGLSQCGAEALVARVPAVAGRVSVWGNDATRCAPSGCTSLTPGSSLLVASYETGQVLRYDAATGAFLGAFASGISLTHGLVRGPDGHLYLGSAGSSEILVFDGCTGALLDVFVPSGGGGLVWPLGMTIGPDGHLYVASHFSGTILRYDMRTGEPLGVFADLIYPAGICFGPDGHLYATSAGLGDVHRFDGTTGAPIDHFASIPFVSDWTAIGLTFGPDGHLYVANNKSDSVLKFDGGSGAPLGTFVASGAGGLVAPFGLDFGPDGDLYVTSTNMFGVVAPGANSVIRFDGVTGAPKGTLVASGSGGLSLPDWFLFW